MYQQIFTPFALLLLLFVFIAGCDAPSEVLSTPSDVVKAYFTALPKGDQKTIQEIQLDGEGVSPLAVGVARSLADERGKIKCSHTIDGDSAMVKAVFDNGEVINAVLVKVDGKWKIDVMANEKLVPASALKGGNDKPADSDEPQQP
ncbi:MAG: hypothetical protein LBK82_01445 [Planctomycetaceae bacterium]|jgi:hypothetical protein|nr:hypothetical protein [Planctomycetaceae bacterium]